MTFNPEIHHRQSIRLSHYDYSSAGFYFVTVCVQGRESLFCTITDGAMGLNAAGRMVENTWIGLPSRFPNLTTAEFTIMPNHFHGILILHDRRGESCIRPSLPENSIPGDHKDREEPGDHKDREEPGDHKDRPYGTSAGSVGRIVQAFKSLTTNAYIKNVKNNHWPPFPGKLWQRNYYERIIRDENELHSARQYIRGNPMKWATDQENPANHP